MAGTVYTAINTIQELRNLLAERYSASSLVKEVVQNADDAGATRLLLALIPGDLSDPHPLRQTSSLLICNNGKFDHRIDDRAIRSMGGGTKSANASTIGKFGLGLKTVFHFCEAFFYYAGGAEIPSFGNLYNPWFEDDEEKKHHNLWEEKPEAYQSQAERLSVLLREKVGSAFENRFFAVVLPLRHESHLLGDWKQRLEPITSDFRELGDVQKLLTADRGPSIARLLALLRHLETIEVFDLTGENPQCELAISIIREKPLRGVEESLWVKDSPQPIRGQVRLVSSEVSDTCIEYFGREWRRDVPELSSLHRQDKWPMRAVPDIETSQQKLDKEKGEPHGAVVLFHTPGTGGTNRIEVSDAVFLPLGTPLASNDVAGQPFDLHLFLHGFSFLDSGRQRRVTDTTPTPKIEAIWNDLLRENVTLPLVLPTLADAHQALGWSFAQTLQITKALASMPPFTPYESGLYSEFQWIAECSDQSLSFGLHPIGKAIRTLPNPPNEHPEFPFKLFPDLSRECVAHDRLYCVTYEELPRLSPNTPEAWTTNLEWLGSLNAETTLREAQELEYLCKFLRQQKHLYKGSWEAWSGWSFLRPRLAEGFATLTSKDDWEALCPLLDVIPSALWLAFENCIDVLPRFVESIQLDKLPLIVLDSALRVDFQDAAKRTTIEVTIARELFAILEQHLAKNLHKLPLEKANALGRLAKQILERTKLEDQQNLADFNVFFVRDSTEKNRISITANELQQVHREHRFFFSQGASSSKSDIDTAQRAVPDARILSLPGGILPDVLWGGSEKPKSFSMVTLTPLLVTVPELAPPVERLELLKAMFRQKLEDIRTDETVKSAMRYLLHGDWNRVKVLEAPLYLPSRSVGQFVPEALARKLAEEAQDEWQLINSLLASEIPQSWESYLNAQPLGFNRIERQLHDRWKKDGADGLRDLPYGGPEEIQSLLKGIDDEDLWRALPLHRTQSDELVSANEKGIYRGGKYPIPPSMADEIRLIAVPEDAELERRYTKRTPLWEAKSLLEYAASSNEPRSHAVAILEALAECSNTIDEALRRKLATVAWLPRVGGEAVSPENVIDIPGSEDAITRLLSCLPEVSPRSTPEELSEDVREHAGFDFVRQKLLSTGSGALAAISQMLERWPACHLGELSFDSDKDVQAFVEALSCLPSDVYPAGDLLRHLGTNEEIGWSSLRDRVIPSLCITCSFAQLKRLVVALAGQKDTQAAWEKLLICLLSHKDCSNAELFDLRLLTGANTWREARSICIDQPGILPDDQVHKSVGKLWKEYRKDDQSRPIESDNETSDTVIITDSKLATYFTPWEKHEARELIGRFLSLLFHNDKGRIRHLIEHYIGGATGCAQRFRDEVEVKIRGGNAYQFNVKICLPGDETTAVPNLFGELIQGRIQQKEVSSLLIGSSRTTLTLRSLPNASNREEVADLLRKSVSDLIILGYLDINRDKFLLRWGNLAKPDSVALKVTQKILLNSAFFYFQQISAIKKLHKISDLLHQHNQIEREKIESGTPLIKESEELRDKLRELLNSPEIRAVTLDAVREKIRQFQYRTDSIAFELFQNADDARAEWDRMTGCGKGEIMFTWTGERVRCFHNGRPINRFRSTGFDENIGRQLGFDCDLQKMLVISSSDKGAPIGSEQSSVTGKFGLGFKSVFLFSKSPSILSENLGFIVRGGMYPEALSKEQEEVLRSVRDRELGDLRGTVIELPRSSEPDVPTCEALLARFTALAPITVIFARRLRTCRMIGPSSEKQIVWRPKEILGAPLVEVGSLGTKRGLFLRCGDDRTGILLGVDVHGFCQLSEALGASVPAFWVTAPTQDETRADFAVNAAFSLDPGRARLGDKEENGAVATQLAAGLENNLIALFDAAHNDWPSLSLQLGLLETSEPIDLFVSLWDRVHGHLAKNDLLAQVCAGYFRFLQRRKAIPTKLPGDDYDVLTDRERVTGALSETLESSETCRIITAWPGFRRRWWPGTVVSEGKIARYFPGEKVPTITLLDVVANELESGGESDRVSPEVARTIGQLGPLLQNSDLSEALRKLCFESASGGKKTADELLIATSGDDEAHRTQFAPDEHILADRYYDDPETLTFFLACRKAHGGHKLGAEKLAAWGKLAESQKARNAFKLYLDSGELGNQVRNQLSNITGTWLEADLAYQQSLRASEALRGQADPTPPTSPFFYEEDESEVERITPTSPSDLERIYSDWMSDPESRHREYDQATYPDGGAFFQHLVEEPNTPQEYEAWVLLFLRGSLEMTGLGDTGQRRAFLQICQEQGWIAAFADRARSNDFGERPSLLPTSSQVSSLFRPFESWITDQIDSDQIPHFHHLRLTMPTFFMMRWLTEYSGSIHRMRDFNMAHFLAPFHGPTRADAPPLKPFLGIGAHFVLRELVRKKLLTKPEVIQNAEPYCFVPSKRIRRLLNISEVGTRADQAQAIYQALCENLGQDRATFNGAFDLPLLKYLKDNRETQ